MADIILVDFFDTVMYREIHSSQLIFQWESILKNKYNMPEDVCLKEMRQKIIEDSGKNSCVLDYKFLIHSLYLKLSQKGWCQCKESEFYEISYMTEIYIDLATQYPNKKMIAYLKRQKKKGKRVFLVTDYYLPGDAYQIFLNQFGLESLFEKIYCSSDYAKTKWEGTLYEEVLKELGSNGKNVCMIGDSRRADVKNSKESGIKGCWYFPVFHKIKTNISRYLQLDFKRVCTKQIYNKAYKYTLFGEYGINLYFFSKKLYGMLLEDGLKKVNFLSRGGYLLRKIFDEYQRFRVCNEEKIDSSYLLNSRKANQMAMKDKEQKNLLIEYFQPFVDADNRLCLVDEGWNCSSQICLTDFLKCDSYGYYIGLLKNQPVKGKCVRKGILFHVDEAGEKDVFYGVFRTNLKFYEQMCQAPDGAVECYIKSGDKIDTVLNRNETEITLYDKYTKTLQQQIEKVARQLIVWEAKVEKKQLALLMLKTLLFANKDRLEMEKTYQDLSYNNYTGTKSQVIGDGKQIKISCRTLLTRPEEYMRYFCKVKEVMSKSAACRYLYWPIGFFIWLWCCFSIRRKNFRED